MVAAEYITGKGLFQKWCIFAAASALFVQCRLRYLGVNPIAGTMVGGNHADLPILKSNKRLNGIVHKIGEGDLIGPESLVVGKYKGTEYIFAALADGRIVRIEGADEDDDDDMRWSTVIRTGEDHFLCGKGGPADTTDTERICGRPLGLALVKRSTVDPRATSKQQQDQDVLVALDTLGLFLITNIYHEESTAPTKRILATHANGDTKPFHLLNAVQQTPDGSLYITETSTQFPRRRIFYAAHDAHPTGRLLRYTKANGVDVLLNNLYMPNGITLSHDKESLIFVSGLQLLSYHLTSHELNVFVHAMPGTGDNIKTMDHLPSGEKLKCYWAALGSKCAAPFCLLHYFWNKPFLRSVLVSLVPYDALVNVMPKFSAFAVYDEQGGLVEVYQDDEDVTAPWLAEAEPLGKYIYLGSWWNPFLGRVLKEDLILADK